MLPEKTTGIHKVSTFEYNQSYKAIQWLESFEDNQSYKAIQWLESFEYNQSYKAIQWLESLGNNIQHARRGGEKIIYVTEGDKKKRYKLDGCYFDRKTTTIFIYEFFGCYFHGCPKCFRPDEICKRKGNKTTRGSQ